MKDRVLLGPRSHGALVTSGYKQGSGYSPSCSVNKKQSSPYFPSCSVNKKQSSAYFPSCSINKKQSSPYLSSSSRNSGDSSRYLSSRLLRACMGSYKCFHAVYVAILVVSSQCDAVGYVTICIYQFLKKSNEFS